MQEYTKKFGCNDIGIIVSSNEPKIISSLNEKFGNYYNDINNEICYKINFIVDNKVTSEYYYDNESGDTTYNYIYGNDKELFIILPYYDGYKDLFVKRIFTTTFVKQFQKHGYTILHGACASKYSKGVIITGNAGSGKTTLLLKLLKNEFTYIANDRLAVKNINGNVIVCGIPFSMGIIRTDIDDISIDKYNYIPSINKIFIENKDIPSALCVDMNNKTILDNIIFCSFDNTFDGIKIEKVKNIVNEFGINIMHNSAIPSQKSYLHDIISSDSCDTKFLNDIYGYRLKQGNNSELDTIDYIDDTLRSKVRKKSD